METPIIAYHQATKHHFRAYARGPGHLDWATQPDPFRRYTGAKCIPLDHPFDSAQDHPPVGEGPDYESPFTEGSLPPHPVNRETISRLFYDALAISAWKQAGEVRWALRVNPSSGNLHPTEGYLIAGPVPGIHDTPAVYHYAPREHGLELRTEFSPACWNTLTAGLPEGSFLLGLTSIHWREAWKYGERAYRYCQHDAGHAIAALSLSAAALGWKTRLLDDVADESIRRILGLPEGEDPEAEHPDCLLAVIPEKVVPGAIGLKVPELPDSPIDEVAGGIWEGVANRLSPDRHPWPAIDEAARAAWKPGTHGIYPAVSNREISDFPRIPADGPPFRRIVHQRRSAQSFDGKTAIPREVFYKILGKTLPDPGRVPFATLPWPAMIHLALFVHRVEGIPPGHYLLLRDPAKQAALGGTFPPVFAWTRPEGCPEGVPLFSLEEGDCTQLAKRLSCQQDIAADGAFSLGMIAEFEEPIRRYGPWFYRRLFWETGVIGQVLYLEAEAAGIRGTGIGCFFDDPVHDLLGIQDLRYQSLYHFTMGKAVDDPRITTLRPYPDKDGHPFSA